MLWCVEDMLVCVILLIPWLLTISVNQPACVIVCVCVSILQPLPSCAKTNACVTCRCCNAMGLGRMGNAMGYVWDVWVCLTGGISLSVNLKFCKFQCTFLYYTIKVKENNKQHNMSSLKAILIQSFSDEQVNLRYGDPQQLLNLVIYCNTAFK